MRPVEPLHYITDVGPDVVWVTNSDNTVVAVTKPLIEADTILGLGQATGKPVAIPLAHVRSVEARVPNVPRTALLAVSVGAAAISALYFGFIRHSGSHGVGVECGYDIRVDPIQYC